MNLKVNRKAQKNWSAIALLISTIILILLVAYLLF